MILVDTSVWVGYFRKGENAESLEKLITLDLICTNEIILSELIPALQHRRQRELIQNLNALPCVPYTIFWEGIRTLQVLNLTNGINKVGLPDLMIAQHCLDQNLELWSLDKHFRLIAQQTTLKLTEF
ncbi:PIN domain-containing protein [Runella sp. MFBS21]|uniref:PIN domain-containing protein n=1 Tax=Runella sp. MFBS21 TaxID=3034018 RepID=UPI0023F85671|nr:PIN domain-containing protein [Runella sp. MFBS21]MDF7816877.1 PIN domain-containing protein [Runella sp. MFBS21]